MNVLIAGGSSGLGLQLGIEFQKAGATVFVTGRSPDAVPETLTFLKFAVTANDAELAMDLDALFATLPHIEVFIYAIAFCEKGRVAELDDTHIEEMVHAGLTAPALMLKRLLVRQKTVDGFIAITSTSQWIPREEEPVYAATKAGFAMLAQSVSLDRRVQKTLVVGPAGMETDFWKGSRPHLAGLLSPATVAREVISLWHESFIYRLVRILRDPLRTEVLETR